MSKYIYKIDNKYFGLRLDFIDSKIIGKKSILLNDNTDKNILIKLYKINHPSVYRIEKLKLENENSGSE